MKAVIFCGGKGTRIRDVAELIPKPMVQIGGKPILWHIMKHFAHYGISEFVLCLGYKGWNIKEYFLNFKAMNYDFTVDLGKDGSTVTLNANDSPDWKITLAETGEEAMTGARLWKVRKYLEGGDQFFVTYGDGLSSINLQEVLNFHKSHGKTATVSGVRPSGRFGELGIDGDVITRFDEKPQYEEGWISGGFMVFDNKKVWDYFWPSETLIMERESLPAMAKDRELRVFKYEGFWMGMDTIREYNILNDLWNSGKAPWKVWA